MESQKKKNILFGLAGVFGLIILCVLFNFVTGLTAKSSVASTNQNQLLSQSTQLPTEQLTLLTQTPTPSVTPTKIPPTAGSVWAIYSIEYLAFQENGFSYDVGTFTNINTGEVIRAHCMNPNWPSPRLGTLYKINEAMVLIPVKENPRHPFQRFYFISY